MFFDQSAYDVRCEWGLAGIERLSPTAPAVVVVDVLSFTTCVDIACARGATIYPYRWEPGNAEALPRFGRSRNAMLPGARRGQGYSLSPASLLAIKQGTRLVLPSPNGSTLSLAVEGRPVLAGCLRNAAAAARAAQHYGPGVLVVPAGERWPDGTLRPAIEDLIGAGAIISCLPGTLSPEAAIALTAFQTAYADLGGIIRGCSSGRELIERGFATDVDLAVELNVSRTAPVLVDGAYSDTPPNS